jgi:hypothetical protein
MLQYLREAFHLDRIPQMRSNADRGRCSVSHANLHVAGGKRLPAQAVAAASDFVRVLNGRPFSGLSQQPRKEHTDKKITRHIANT